MALSLRKLTVLVLALGLILVLLVSSAIAQNTDGVLIVSSTQDDAVVVVSGNGFDPSQSVTLNIYQIDGSPLGSFAGSTTDSTGSFSFNLTLPYISQTSIYTFIANTSTVSGITQHILFSQAPSTPSPTGIRVAAVTAFPSTSNIFNVTGVGFEVSKTVSLRLTNAANLPAYIFPDQVTTDPQGRFSAILIVPTTKSGTYNLVAYTSTRSTANYTVTVPNLQGPAGNAGPSGVPGASGAPGASGQPGTNGTASSTAGTDIGYVGVALGVVALAIAVFALVRGRHVAAVSKTDATQEKT
jgi:hypothetical protein